MISSFQCLSSIYAFLRHFKWVGTALTLALCPHFANAQGNNPTPTQDADARWYEVEVAIFTHNQDPQSASELWSKDFSLIYPSRWVKLKGLPELNVGAETTTADLNQTPADGGLIDPSPEALEPAFDPMRDIAFHVLPETELRLKDQVRKLQRSRQFRVLFHQAWRQRFIENSKDTPSILIHAGNQYGDHFELEGSLSLKFRKINNSFSFDVETNLWLTRFVSNYGQEPQDWPELPPIPLEASSVDRLDAQLAPAADRLELQDSINSRTGTLNTAPNFNMNRTDNWEFHPLTSEYDSVLSKPYLADHIILVKQQRKVNRSEEIHYIDHPQLGILVHFIRYELPATEPEDVISDFLQETLQLPAR